MSKASRKLRRKQRRDEQPDWLGGRWTGPDVWTRANGRPSAARLIAERLGYDWQRGLTK